MREAIVVVPAVVGGVEAEVEVAETGDGEFEEEDKISEAVAARDSRGPRQVRARFDDEEEEEFGDWYRSEGGLPTSRVSRVDRGEGEFRGGGDGIDEMDGRDEWD